MDILLPQVT
jgi:translocator protein